jgi:hypothetical protein
MQAYDNPEANLPLTHHYSTPNLLGLVLAVLALLYPNEADTYYKVLPVLR